MENEQIKQKILAETKSLLTLKVDNAELVKDKFRTLTEHLKDLRSSVVEENEIYLKASNHLSSTMDAEYKQFCDSTIHEEREQALIQLKHKAAEACEILRTV